jgi:hypothetical protein
MKLKCWSRRQWEENRRKKEITRARVENNRGVKDKTKNKESRK